MYSIPGLIRIVMAAISFENFSQISSKKIAEPPRSEYLSFQEFSQKFNLGTTTTEKSHPLTKHLSQTMALNPIKGLDILLEVDQEVATGLETFIPQIDTLAPQIADHLKNQGRVFLVGSGSSGRVAIDIAAKCTHAFPSYSQSVIGIIAGGESAMIKAKEGFEDSDKDGEKSLYEFHLTPNDVVILISSSGSASFNVGAGHYAANQNAHVYYFYNSKEIPLRTQQLFSRINNPVVPLELDIGPQAISGSTRLQGATLAEACLNGLLGSALHLAQNFNEKAKAFPRDLAKNMKDSLRSIHKQKEEIAKLIHAEVEVFSNPQANFRRLRDETNQGYVTFIALEDSMREILIDSTETSPTFSINPIQRVGDTTKQPEFSPYLIGKKSNLEAWNTLLGKETNPVDRSETDRFILDAGTLGDKSYEQRPKGQGNLVIGVAKIPHTSSEISKDLIDALKAVKAQNGNTGIILICSETLSQNARQEILNAGILPVIIENVRHDCLGVNQTIVLKETLNLISNGSMILMKKVHGNTMIDVRTSNMKLIDRAMRLVKEIWTGYNFPITFTDEKLYHDVCQVNTLKNAYEAKESVQVAGVVKIVFALLYLDKAPTFENFKEVTKLLSEKQDDLEAIIGH